MKEIVKLDNIEKYYGYKGNITKAIDRITFSINEGEFVGIMGPSGSGKTTLLNCISTIDNISSGSLIINNINVSKLKFDEVDRFRRNELGFIFQEFNLLDTLTCYENIALALAIKNKKTSDIKELVIEISKKLEISDILNKFPYQISGGQKQRVACARAIISNPSLILADEPTGALDSKSARIVLESIDKLNKDMNATILMVTHDSFTASYANRILFIKDGKIFTEIDKGNKSRKEFFDEIISVVTLLGGDVDNVL